MANSRRRLARDDEDNNLDADEAFLTIKSVFSVTAPDEADRLREMLASWLVGEAAAPEPAASAAEDRRRRLGHDAALLVGVAPFSERYPFAARVRVMGR